MPITTILNKDHHSYDMYTLIAKNLLGLKRNDSTLTFTTNINVIFEGELFNFDELLDLICMNKNYCSEEEKMEYLFNNVHLSEGMNKYSALIIYLYDKYGIDQMLQLIDGAYNLVLFDMNLNGDYSNLYIVNDPFGTKKIFMIKELIEDNTSIRNTPLARMQTKRSPLIIFTNSMGDIDDVISKTNINHYNIKEIKAGTYYHYNYSHKVLSNWELYTKRRYYALPITNISNNGAIIRHIKCNMKNILDASLEKRIKNNAKFAYKYREGGFLQDMITDKYDSTLGFCVKLLQFKTSDVLRESSAQNYKIPPKVTAIFVDDIETSEVEAILGHLEDETDTTDEKVHVLLVDDGIDEIFGNAYININDLIEFDNYTRLATRNILYTDVCGDIKIYNPFFDKELLQFYFSIPLIIRFELRENNELLRP